MSLSILAQIAGLAGLAPLALFGRRDGNKPDPVFWGLAVIAILGSGIAVMSGVGAVWEGGLSTALWSSVVTTLLLFTGLSVVMRDLWRLGAPLGAYLIPVAVAAVLFDQLSHAPNQVPQSGWFWIHVGVSLATYGLLTLSAIAAVGFLVQERALKNRKPTGFSRTLPALRDSEKLLVNLLSASALVLFIGVASGYSLRLVSDLPIWELDHKTLFSLIVLVAIFALLFTYQRFGLRGRQVVRVVLSAYLLLTIAYLGVKIVTDLLIGSA